MSAPKLIVLAFAAASLVSLSTAVITAGTPYGYGVLRPSSNGLQTYVGFKPDDPSLATNVTRVCGEAPTLPCRQEDGELLLALGDILRQGEVDEPFVTDTITVTTSCCGRGTYQAVSNRKSHEIFHFKPDSTDQTSFIKATCFKGVGVPCEQAFGGLFNLAWSEITSIGIVGDGSGPSDPDCDD